MFPVREKVSFANIMHSAQHLSVKHLYRMLELLKREPYLLTFEIQPITISFHTGKEPIHNFLTHLKKYLCSYTDIKYTLSLTHK
jgi:hypothetical protein